MKLSEVKIGEKFLVKEINERSLDSRLLSLGVCRGDACYIENVANGNVLIKTTESKIVVSLNLADKIDIEIIK